MFDSVSKAQCETIKGLMLFFFILDLQLSFSNFSMSLKHFPVKPEKSCSQLMSGWRRTAAYRFGLHSCASVYGFSGSYGSHCEKKIYYILYVCCCRVLGAMANASPDLDNAEAQRQLNNNNRQIGSGFWETEVTSSKLFECSRIKALAGQKSTAPSSQT